MIAGVHVVERRRIGDERGHLERLFCADSLSALGWDAPIMQVNHTLTRRRGSVRGMHFQRAPHAELKLVSCIRGEVWDVALDLRAGSPTFLKWHAQHLSAENGAALLIPRGCAHGFQTLSDDVELIYCHSVAYQPSAEGGVNPLDTRVGIRWPLEVIGLSERDAGHPFIDEHFVGLTE